MQSLWEMDFVVDRRLTCARPRADLVFLKYIKCNKIQTWKVCTLCNITAITNTPYCIPIFVRNLSGVYICLVSVLYRSSIFVWCLCFIGCIIYLFGVYVLSIVVIIVQHSRDVRIPLYPR